MTRAAAHREPRRASCSRSSRSLGRDRRCCGTAPSAAPDLAIFAGHVPAHRLGITVGFHRLFTHRAFETSQPAAQYAFAVLGSMAVAGPGHQLGRRPPQAPRVHRRGGRPAQPARRPRRGSRRARAASGTPTSAGCFRTAGPRRRRALRPGPRRGPRPMRWINRAFPLVVPRRCALPFAARLRAQRHARRRRSPALLWGGLVRIFLVHHVTWSINSVCHFFGRRRFDTDDESTQRLLARAALARRGLAPQPPRLPALGLPRPALVRARPLGLAHPRRWSGSAWPGTSCASAPSARQPCRPSGSRPSRCRPNDVVQEQVPEPVGASARREHAACWPRRARACAASRTSGPSSSRSSSPAPCCCVAPHGRPLALGIYAVCVTGLLGTSALYHRVTGARGAALDAPARPLDDLRADRRHLHAVRAARAARRARDRDPDRRLGGRARGVVLQLFWIDAPKWLVGDRLRRRSAGSRWSRRCPAGAIGWARRAARCRRRRPAVHGRRGRLRAASGRTRCPTVFGYHEVFHVSWCWPRWPTTWPWSCYPGAGAA